MNTNLWKQVLGVALSLSMMGGACSSRGSSPESTSFAKATAQDLPAVASFVQGSTGFAAFKSEKVRNAAMTYPVAEIAVSEVPLSLTADDGTGLVLERYDASAVVEGPLAFTELRLTFRNPLQRVLEGRFQMTLPDGATVSRLAMKMDNGWREAEMVERMAARRAYEDFLHRKQDPMLLEKEAGNQFRARIFPIPAGGTKEIIVSFSHEVGSEAYTLPLRGMPEIAALSMRAQVAVRDKTGIHYETVAKTLNGIVPTEDFSVARSELKVLRNGSHLVARVKPQITAAAVSLGGMTILFDTSASRAPGFSKQVQRLGTLISAIAQEHGRDLPIVVAAFDQEVTPVYAGAAGSFGAKAKTALLARRPLGSSDLAAALHWAGKKGQSDRLLVVSDAVVTSGEDEIAAAAKALPSQIERIDMLLVGGIRDKDAAGRLVRGTRKMDGVLLSADSSDAEMASRLGKATSTVEFTVPGADWIWPNVAHGVQPGDELLVYAGYAKGVKAPEFVSIKMKGAESLHEVPVTLVPGPLVDRSAVQAHINQLQGAYLEEESNEKKKALKDKIIAMSTKYRVLSDFTALLVLEQESDYARFGIARNALSDILVIGKNGLTLEQRNTLIMVAEEKKTEGKKNIASGKKGKMKKDRRAKAEEDGSFDEVQKSEDLGLSFSGSSSLENQYVVDGVNVTEQAPVVEESLSPPPAPPSSVSSNSPTRPNMRPSPRPVPRQEERAVPGRTFEAQIGGDDDDADTQGGASPQGPAFKEQGPPALTGRMASIHNAIVAGRVDDALAEALVWRNEEAGQVMALVALGEALEAAGHLSLAARAYGSILDLFPSRADLRRFAGARLSQLGEKGIPLSIDSLKRAVKQRPDHLSVHRLYAYALIRASRYEEAFAAIEFGLNQNYPSGRFAGGIEILREDLGIVAAAWLARDSSQRASILLRLKKLGIALAITPSTRFVLNWETDANDVDFHILDAKGGHAFFSQKELPSGGRLFADVTTGYGPECFAISGKATAYPYKLQIHYYSRGPMGYGMGQVEILQHDGKGGLKFDDRPFVVMNDNAYVDLGEIKAPL